MGSLIDDYTDLAFAEDFSANNVIYVHWAHFFPFLQRGVYLFVNLIRIALEFFSTLFAHIALYFLFLFLFKRSEVNFSWGDT